MPQVIIQQPWATLPLISALLRRKVVAVNNFQPLAIRLNKLNCSAEQRAEFRLMFNCQQLPPSFLFNVGYRYLGQLLAQAKLPSKLLGLIHLSSDFTMYLDVNWSKPFDLVLAIKSCTHSNKGLIYQMDLTLFQEEKLSLTCVNRLLDKDKTYKGKQVKKTVLTNDNNIASQPLTCKLAREYAKLSGDFNPIHLHAVSAKFFGMKTAIMHGMYNLHWCLVHIPKTIHAQRISAQFNRPCYLPSKVALAELTNSEYGLFSNNQQDRHLHIKINHKALEGRI